MAYAAPLQGPLSFAQERLWFLHQVNPASCAYNELFTIRLDGALTMEALRESVDAIAQRHQPLRTRYEQQQDGVPVQIVMPAGGTPVPVVDVSQLHVATRGPQRERLLASLYWHPFDLQRGPVFRGAVLRHAPNRHELVIVIHHIACDGWSFVLFAAELVAGLAARLTGSSPGYPTVDTSYLDAATHERATIAPDRIASHLAYWESQLADLPEAILPADDPRPEVPTGRGGWQEITFQGDVLEALRELARRSATTLSNVLLATFRLLLFRYTGQADMSIGLAIAGRRPETERAIGFFSDTLILRLIVDDAQTFAQFVRDITATTFQAYAHQPMPYQLLVQQLRPGRDLGEEPLYRIVWTYQTFPWAASHVRIGGVQVSTGEGLWETNALYDLRCLVYDEGTRVRVRFEYARDLFRAETADRLLRTWEALIRIIPMHETTTLSQIPLLREAERVTLARWNQTARVWPPAVSLVELFAAQAAQTPDAIALSADAGEVSYAVLAAQAGWLAAQLQARGVGPDRCVALVLPRGLELIVAILGVLQAGGAYVPLDPEAPPARLRQMLADVEAVVLLTDAATDVAALADACPVLVLAGETLGPAAGAPAGAARPVGLQPAHLAYVIYTSGSTGRPKAVAIPHAALTNHMRWLAEAFALTAADVILQKTPASFDAAVWECVAPLLTGGRLALAAPGEQRDPAQLVARLQQTQTTVVQFVPSVLAEVAAQPALAACRSLRVVCAGGEGFPVGLHARLTAALPETQIVNLYGPTEVTIDSTAWHGVPPARGILPLGRLMPNVQGYVREATGALAPIGARGELAIGGVSLARGYLGQPARTAAAFVPDAVSGAVGARLYRSGDQVRWQADGTLAFLGRRDQQVKFRGQRLELGEIEAALRRLPDVHQAVVVLRTEPPGPPRLVAYVVGPPSLQPARLRVALHAGLPAGLIPSVIVPLAQLPLTPHGKVDRRALPPPEPATAAPPGAPPRPGLEELVASLWTQVLGRAPTTRDAQFFALGGHSLLATQVSARLRAALGVEVPLRVLFEHPTLQALAAWLATARGASGPPRPPVSPVPRPPEGLPLSFAQQRLWFLSQLDPTSRAYLIPYALRLRGPLAGPALAHSLAAVVARHEILRTRLVAVHGEPRQVVDPTATLALPVIDLGALAPATQATAVRARQTAEATRPVPLDQAPLLRATLLRLAPADHVLLLTWHHVISDGWSVALFVDELRAGYAAARQRRAPAWPALPVQYGDVAVWQRRWLTGDALATLTRYWRQQLAGLRTLPLPTDRPRPATPTHRGALQRVTWAAPRTVALRAFSQREGVTLFMTLLAGLALVLGRWAGEDEVALGTDVANRTQVETEGLLGFFVNQLVLRVTLPGAGTFRALLRHVRDVTLDAYAHQDLPFDRLVEELQPARQLAAAPLFQIKLVLQTARQRLELPRLDVQEIPNTSCTAKFDLTLVFEEDGDTLHGLAEFATDLWDRDTIDCLTERLGLVLDAAMQAPDRPLHALPLFVANERSLVLDDWNATRAVWPDAAAVHELAASQASRSPDAIALVFGDQQITYGEWLRRATQLANYLQLCGTRPDMRVAICLDRSPELLIAILGVLLAGGAYVPLDPQYPAERLAYMLDDSGAALLLMHRATRDRVPAHWLHEICLDADADRDAIAAAPERPLPPLPTPDALAYVIYTSGSTGTPKGVAVTHASLANLARAQIERFQTRPGLIVLQYASSSFDAAASEWTTTLLAGGRLVLASRERLLPGPELIDLIAREQIELATLPPTVLSLVPPASVPTLRTVISAGEPCRGAWVSAWAAHRRLLNAYGPTEATVCATMTEPIDATSATAPTLGSPIANVRVYVVEPGGEPAARGIPGELWIGGSGVSRGYLDQPALTAERFVPDPFSGEPGVRLYRSGDLVRWRADGTLDYLGRLDHQIKLRGYRIEAGEIETVLQRQPGVRQAVVVLRQDDPDPPRLVAYILAGPDAPDTNTPWRAALQARLPEYMVPAAIVRLAQLPLTASGKVDRRALPPPEPLSQAASAPVAPRTPVERQLAAIWEQVLKRTPIGVHDNFFELGGDSILSLQIVARAQQAGLALTVPDLFQQQTIAAAAAGLTPVAGAPGVEEASEVPGDIPLTPIQRWFFTQPRASWHAYVQALACEVAAPLDVRALRHTWRRLGQAHAALRSRFAPAGETWRQWEEPADDGARWVTRVDLAAIAPAARPAWLAHLAAAAGRSLDLAAGPLVRVLYADAGPHAPGALVLVAHHLVVDGVSWRILLDDLAAAAAPSGGAAASAAPAPPRGTSYRAWSHTLVRLSTDARVEAARAWWQAQVTAPAGRVPRDRAGANHAADARRLTVRARPALTRALLDVLPRVARHPVQVALLAAVAQTLGAWMQHDTVLIDLESHGRQPDLWPALDLARTVGWCTSVAPLRLPGGGAAPLDAVAAALQARPHHGLSYGLLRYLAPDGAALASPAEVLVNYLGQFDAVLGPESRLAPAAFADAIPDPGADARAYLLEINAAIQQHALQITWTYSDQVHRADTIAQLAQGVLDALDRLVEAATADAGRPPRPADFPDADLSQQDLNALLAELQG